MHVFEKNIKDLDLIIPDLATPVANYVPYKIIEKLKINSELNGMKAIVDSNGLGGFYCLIAEKL